MTETTPSNVVWLTQAKYDELKAELEELRGPRRAELVKRVSDARDEGDLKENAGYHAARDELGKLDGRIAQLIDMLERAKVGETPADDGVVEPGMKVTIYLSPATKQDVPARRPRDGLGDTTSTVFSPQSPLGEAINGAQRGDTVDLRGAQRQEVQGRDPRGRSLHRLSSLDDAVAVLAQPRQHPRRRARDPASPAAGPPRPHRRAGRSRCARGRPRARWRRSRRARRAGRASPPGRSGMTQWMLR